MSGRHDLRGIQVVGGEEEERDDKPFCHRLLPVSSLVECVAQLASHMERYPSTKLTQRLAARMNGGAVA